jgi:hypothetical protein
MLMRPASDMSAAVDFITSSRLPDPVICGKESPPLGQDSHPGKTGPDQLCFSAANSTGLGSSKSTLLQQPVWRSGVFSTSAGDIFNDLRLGHLDLFGTG